MNDIPKTPFALISGSAGWGIKFPDDLREPGVRVLERGLSFETPWGPSENWQVIEFDGSLTPDGQSRQVLNVFAHGWAIDRVDHEAHRRVFWILNEAGVRKVLSDSTCGSINRAVQPRDYVIANDCIYLGETDYSVLPGRFKYVCRGKQLFCPDMAAALESVARELWPARDRVYGYNNCLVTAHTWGPRFETPAEARAFQQMDADIINQSIAPEATNAREIGACFVSGTYVVNYVDGVLPHEWGELDRIHDDLGSIAARVSLRAIARVALTDECGCSSYRKTRPAKYMTVGQKG